MKARPRPSSRKRRHGPPAEDIRRVGREDLRRLPERYRLLRNIPFNVWEYYIGGYQVVKKWLSYREDEILGRAEREEAREVTNMARRLAAIMLLNWP